MDNGGNVMGLFSNMKALTLVQKIKSGSTESISLAQISNMIINLPDAQRNLTKEQFNAVYKLYKEFQKCNSKIPTDLNAYYAHCIRIIKKFDAIAPYEKYSGGNELEFSFFMDEIRGDKGNGDASVLEEKHRKTAVDYLSNFNYIEVDMIINQYIDFFASVDGKKYPYYFVPETALPFYHEGWKDTLNKAAKIHVAYYILWGNSQEYIEQFLNLLQQINRFVPEENAKGFADTFEAIRSGKTNMGKIALPKIEMHPINDIVDAYNQMLDYKNNVFLKQSNRDEIFQAVTDYCFEAYKCAGVEYKEGYDIYFFTFSQMCKFAEMDQLKKYYIGYEEYIHEHAN